MWSLLTVHCVVSRTALVTLPTAGHGSPHPPALQRCTVLYCAVLYTVLCPPHYTLPTLHTCDKCDMLVRRELNNSAPSVPITSSHQDGSQAPRPLCSAQLAPAPGQAVLVRAGAAVQCSYLPPLSPPRPAHPSSTQRRQCTIEHPENFHTPEVGHINNVYETCNCAGQICSVCKNHAFKNFRAQLC